MVIDLIEEPRQLAVINPPRTDVYVQMLSGTHCHLASNRQTLEDDSGGLQFTPTDGILWFSWRGPLWVRGFGKLSFEII